MAPAIEASRNVLRYGLLGGLFLAVLLLGQQAVLGRSPFAEPGEWREVWVALVHCFGFAYLPAAYVGTLLSGRRAAAELGVDGVEDGSLEGTALPPFGPLGWGFVLAGAAGVVAMLFGPWLAEPGVGGPWYFWAPQGWSPEVYWHRVLGIGIGLFGGWYALAVFRVSRRFSRLARRIEVRDVFDPAPLRPFTRLGLANGLAAAGIATFVGLLGLDLGLTMMLAVFGGFSLVLVSVAVMLPVLGVRDRMRAAKDAELAWCEGAIARERRRVRSREGGEDGGRLTSLVAYRDLVGDIRTWPFDTAALRRVVFYLLIPALSWTASAMVQASVERWMGD